MSQVKTESCLDWKTPRPYLVPRFIGELTTDVRPLCEGATGEKSRRDDGLTQRYGHGVPTMNSTKTTFGVSTGSAQRYTIASTPEGSVKLPVHDEEINYTPSVEALNILTNTVDTRLAHAPARYYR